MLYPKLFVAILASSLISSIAQSQPIVPTNKSFVTVDHEVWDLKSNGKIEIFNTTGTYNERTTASLSYKNINNIAKDKYDNVYISVNNDRLLRLRKNDTTWTDVTPPKFNGEYDFIVNANGKVFQVTHDGIIDAQNGKAYVPEKEFCFSEYRFRGGLFGGWDDRERPSLMLDHLNRLWVVVSYGEWGDDAFCFNTLNNSFFKITGDISDMVGSFCDAKDRVIAYGSGRQEAPFTQFGFLTYFSDFSPTIKNELVHHAFYVTDNNPQHTKLMEEQKSLYPEDYIGQTAYNSVDKMLYFYCKFGLYKGDMQKPLNDITKWNRVNEFRFMNSKTNEDGKYNDSSLRSAPGLDLLEYNKINMPFDIFNMEFTDDGKLVFIVESGGLGIFDGNKITMLHGSATK